MWLTRGHQVVYAERNPTPLVLKEKEVFKSVVVTRKERKGEEKKRDFHLNSPIPGIKAVRLARLYLTPVQNLKSELGYLQPIHHHPSAFAPCLIQIAPAIFCLISFFNFTISRLCPLHPRRLMMGGRPPPRPCLWCWMLKAIHIHGGTKNSLLFNQFEKHYRHYHSLFFHAY